MSGKKYVIVGQGLAGTLLAWELLQNGCEILVYDEGHHHSASSVAAGLINPITGRRMVKSEMIDVLMPIAEQTYLDLEAFLGEKLWYSRRLLWTLSTIKEENDWALRSSAEGISDYIEQKPKTDDIQHFFKKDLNFGEIKNAAQVDLPTLISAFRRFLKAKNILKEEKYISQNTDNHIVIYCEGAKAADNPMWSWLPFSLAKGEALHLKFDTDFTEKIIKNNVSLIPLSDGTYWLGSNYEWNATNSDASPAIQKTFLQELDQFLTAEYQVVAHRAAIRPTTKDRRPMLGFHPKNPSIAIFNGLGTKGTSLAPYWAKHFVKVLLKEENLDKMVDIKRFSLKN
jgi:glycine oxidase